MSAFNIFPRGWRWLGDEGNARAIGVLVVGLPAALAACTFIYTSLRPPEPEKEVIIPAADMWSSDKVNVAPTNSCYAGLVLNQPPYEIKGNSATYRVVLRSAGRYQLFIEYAAMEPRPLKVEVNGVLTPRIAADQVSGGWCNYQLRWDTAGEVPLRRGDNYLRLYTEDYFPHLKTIKLLRL